MLSNNTSACIPYTTLTKYCCRHRRRYRGLCLLLFFVLGKKPGGELFFDRGQETFLFRRHFHFWNAVQAVAVSGMDIAIWKILPEWLASPICLVEWAGTPNDSNPSSGDGKSKFHSSAEKHNMSIDSDTARLSLQINELADLSTPTGVSPWMD